jgi:spore germination protein
MKKHLKKSIVVALLVVMLLILTVPVASAAGGSYHTVRWGETLYSIGRLYGVNPNHIANVNDLYNPDHIYAGQVLYIPTGYYDGGYDGRYNNGYDGRYHGDYDGGYSSCRHIVSYGETLTSIGYRYGVSPWAIASANHVYNLNCIYAGQSLYIPAGGGCY